MWCWIIRSLAAAELLFQGVLRHCSSTIRIQWGGPKYCSRPCTPDAAAGLRTDPQIISRRTTGALTTILQGPCRPTVARCSQPGIPCSDGRSQPAAAKNQATASSLPNPGLLLVTAAAPRSQSQPAITARDVAALPSLGTGNLMHSARETL